jgi:carboxypeptidase Taq
MVSIKDSYEDLLKIIKEKLILIQIQSILGWDYQTHMPPKAVMQRATQNALLASLIHEKRTDPKIGELLEEVRNHEEFNKLNEIEKRNIEIIRREYDRYSKVPIELAVKLAKQRPIAIEAWTKAKQEKKFSLLKPEMEKILKLVRERCHYINPEMKPIDVILDEFEPGINADLLTSLFQTLKKSLIPLLKNIQESETKPDPSLLKRDCPLEIQEALSEAVAKVVHYDLDRGRIDTSPHPFTTGVGDDVRITTKYVLNDFSDSFFSIMHEAGHAIYNQNLNKDWKYQQVGLSCSGGIHESQSRFIENFVGRSSEFWQYYLPFFNELTKGIYSDISLDDFVFAINEVKPSKIRVNADEVTYSLHIILRFEIERDLLAGKITLEELPQIWNSKYKEYLGIDFENDSEGVMQDIHWAAGGFGGFSFYALGNMYGAQILSTMKKHLPNYKELITQGKIKPIVNWLNENVHQKSNLVDPLSLVENITGEPLDPRYFLNYLEEKYSKLYQF